MPLSPLIDPLVLGRVSRLELVARQAVEGFLSGRHPSPYFGSSVEYADHRPYTLGDDPRSIDWKLLAKTRRHYIKLFAEQTNTRGLIVVDSSASMAFGSGALPGKPNDDPTTKQQYAFRLALALAYLMLRQNDAVGLALADRELRTYLPPRGTPSHFRHMVNLLDDARSVGESRLPAVLHELASRFRKRGIVVVISDLLDDAAQLADALAHHRFDRHEVIVFHVVDPVEMEFPFEKLSRFKDLEGVGTLVANPRTVRAQYLERFRQHRESLRRACLERGVAYELARTDTPYDQLLSAFLEKRAQATRG